MQKKTKNGLEIVEVSPRVTLRLSPEDAEKLRKGTSDDAKRPITAATVGRTRTSAPKKQS